MKRLLTVTLFLLGLVQAAMATPPFPGTVSLDSAEARPGDHFSVAVRLTGGEIGLSGLTIPIHFASAHLTVDSVSFVGSIAPVGIKQEAIIDNGNKKVKISFFPDINMIPLQSIPQSGGLLARIYFNLSVTAVPEVIELDTVYIRDSVVMPDLSVVYVETETLNAADGEALTTLYPAFIAGLVSVQVPTGSDEDHQSLPQSFSLAQNYPNPFNPSTQISFVLPKRSKAELEVFNVLGQRVATLVNEVLPAGEHTVTFDASLQPSGIYFYRLTHNEGSETKKMVFLK